MSNTERKVETYKIIEEIWKDSLETDLLVKDKDFFMQSGDSLKFIKLLGDIEDRFDIILEFEEFEDNYSFFLLSLPQLIPLTDPR